MRTNSRDDVLDDYFAARGPALRRTAYVVLHDWHEAEDMVQATFVKVYLAWPRIRRDSLDAYVRRTLINSCLSRLRKAGREEVHDAVPDTPTTDPEPATPLTDLLHQLPPQQRAVVALRFLDDLSVQDTAHVLGVAEGTVKSQTARALRALRNDPLLTQGGDTR